MTEQTMLERTKNTVDSIHIGLIVTCAIVAFMMATVWNMQQKLDRIGSEIVETKKECRY